MMSAAGLAVQFVSPGEDVQEYKVLAPAQRLFTEVDAMLVSLPAVAVAWQLVLFTAGSDAPVRFGLTTVLLLVAIFRLFCRYTRIKEESLLIMRDIGVQFRTTAASGKETSKFVAKSSIKCIVINEGVHNQQYIYYMAFAIKNHHKLAMAFQHIYPRLADLLPIFHASNSLLRVKEDETS
jgi:phosphatidylinositol glycan class H protein